MTSLWDHEFLPPKCSAARYSRRDDLRQLRFSFWPAQKACEEGTTDLPEALQQQDSEAPTLGHK